MLVRSSTSPQCKHLLTPAFFSASVACAIKTSYLPKIGTWTDFTFNVADVLVWSLAESSITIVAASIPFLRMMVRRKMSHVGTSDEYPHSRSHEHTLRPFHNNWRVDVYSTGLETHDDDHASDRSILGATQVESHGIVLTQQVDIQFKDAASK